MKMTAQFRAALAEPDPQPFIFPTVLDAFTAQVVAQMGFKACYLGSSTTSNTLLGKPDCRYLTHTEMEFMLRRAASGAAMIPPSQAILMETFPSEEHEVAMAMSGMGLYRMLEIMAILLAPSFLLLKRLARSGRVAGH